MDEAEIAIGSFVISGGETSGVLELVEAALDHVAQGIDVGIDRQLHAAVPPGRDRRHAAALFHILANKISIIAFVDKRYFGRWPVGTDDRHITLESDTSPLVRATAMGKPIALMRRWILVVKPPLSGQDPDAVSPFSAG